MQDLVLLLEQEKKVFIPFFSFKNILTLGSVGVQQELGLHLLHPGGLHKKLQVVDGVLLEHLVECPQEPLLVKRVHLTCDLSL